MAQHDYETMTDEELLQAAHAAGVDSTSPNAPSHTAVTPDSGMSTAEKVGAGLLGGAGAALALKFPALRESIANLASRAGAEAPLWAKAGLRTAESSPVARNLAGESGMEALRLHTAEVGRTVAANEAGIPAAQAPLLSQDILIDARRAPNSVYDRVEKALPAGTLDAQARQEIGASGLPQGGRMSKGSPQAQAQIDELRQQLLDPQKQFTGTQMMNELRGLRQEGYTNISSDDVSNQQLGRAQLSMARAIEGHIGRNIPAGADVTLDQFLAARKTLAKNFTVQKALRGGDIDLKALARIQRADPELLDGGTKMLADFGENHPEVAALPTEGTKYNPPGIARDIQDISLKNPATWLRPFVGEAARKSLVGDTEAAVAQANKTFPAQAPGRFAPIPAPPPPAFGGYLPSPEMVNAGGGATTPSTLESLGLTPDVQTAGAQHPAAAKLQALREQLSRPPMEQVEFQGPQKWGDFALTPGQSVAPALQMESIPFENVLEQGGTQGKPVAGIKSGYRPAPQSPKGPAMRTPEGPPELTEAVPQGPSPAQEAFRNKLAADRLRKLAGDLTMEGPGGSTGSPTDRLRAALERRQRGYAEGGEVPRGSSSPGSPGVSGAVHDALAALRDYFVGRSSRDVQAAREARENAIINATGPEPAAAPPTNDYAGGGEVVDFAKRGTQALMSRIEQAFHNPYTADWNQLRQDISKYWTTAAPVAQAAETAPPPLIAAPKEESLEDITKSLHDLLTPGSTEQFAGGGRVEMAQKLAEFLERVSAQKAAQDAEIAARLPRRPPLVQLPEDPLVHAATAPPEGIAAAGNPDNPLQPGFLMRPQAKADGGSVDDSQSSVRTLADLARKMNPYAQGHPAEDRARIATNLASLAYGLDAHGKPAFGGRAWTTSQGGTPAGVLDALTAVPHNIIQLAATFDKYLPGKSNPQFWAAADPQWSKQASDRLGQLRQRMQQAAGVAPAHGLEDTAIDIATDPAMVAPMGAAKAASEGSALRKVLNFAMGASEDPTKPAQGYAKGGSVKKEEHRERPIQEFPRDERGLFIEPDVLTKEIIVQIEHNRQRAANKAYYADKHCGLQKGYDPKGKNPCGECNQADGDHCLLVEDDLLPKLKNGRFPPLVIDRKKGSCGPWEIIDPNDPEQRGNRLPASIAGYGVRKGGGPDDAFGCHVCWKQKKSKHPVLLDRVSWCGEWGTTVELKACCVVNGAPTEKRG